MIPSLIDAAPPGVPVVKPVERDHSETRSAFENAVGSLFYGEMLKAMRAGTGKIAYMDGGMGEKLFQSQFDQQVADSLSKQSGNSLVDTLYRRFMDGRTSVKPSATFAGPNSATQSANFSSPAELAELARQTHSAPDVLQTTTATTGLSGLLRK